MTNLAPEKGQFVSCFRCGTSLLWYTVKTFKTYEKLSGAVPTASHRNRTSPPASRVAFLSCDVSRIYGRGPDDEAPSILKDSFVLFKGLIGEREGKGEAPSHTHNSISERT